MGFQAWSKLSVLVVASAALVGCTGGPEKNKTLIGQQKTNPQVNNLAQGQNRDFPTAGQGNLSPFAQQNPNLLTNIPQQQKPLNLQPATGPGAGQAFPTPPNLGPQINNPAPLPFPGQTPTTNSNPVFPTPNQGFNPINLPAPPSTTPSTTFGTSGRDTIPIFPPPAPPR